MRTYETGFILSPELSEEEIRDFLSNVRKFIEDSKGIVIQEEHWGRRKLAYKISKYNEGNYYFFLYKGDPPVPKELERRFRQSEKVIRFLTIKMDDYIKKVEKMKQKKERKKVRSEGEAKESEMPFEKLEEEKNE